MPRPAIAIARYPNRAIKIQIDGRTVAETDYDECGWSGLDAVTRTARGVAEALGGTVEEIERDYDGEDDEEATTR